MGDICKREGCGLKTLRNAFKQFGIAPRKRKTQAYYDAMQEFWTDEQRLSLSTDNPNKKRDRKYWVGRFHQVHGEKYSYEHCVFDGTFNNVDIHCPLHGTFQQTPSNHASGRGCPECGKDRLIGGYNLKHFERNPKSKTRPAVFYIVEMWDDHETFIKCGITVQRLSSRLSGQNPYQYRVLTEKNNTLYHCFIEEQNFIEKYMAYRYVPTKKFNGYTECFCKTTPYK